MIVHSLLLSIIPFPRTALASFVYLHGYVASRTVQQKYYPPSHTLVSLVSIYLPIYLSFLISLTHPPTHSLKLDVCKFIRALLISLTGLKSRPLVLRSNRNPAWGLPWRVDALGTTALMNHWPKSNGFITIGTLHVRERAYVLRQWMLTCLCVVACLLACMCMCLCSYVLYLSVVHVQVTLCNLSPIRCGCTGFYHPRQGLAEGVCGGWMTSHRILVAWRDTTWKLIMIWYMYFCCFEADILQSHTRRGGVLMICRFSLSLFCN